MHSPNNNKKFKPNSHNNRLCTAQVKSVAIKNGYDEDNLNYLHRDCPLCLKEYNNDTGDDNVNINKISICNPCKHPFCFDCLCTCLQDSNKCPICRTQIESILIQDSNKIMIEKTYNDFLMENNITVNSNLFGYNYSILLPQFNNWSNIGTNFVNSSQNSPLNSFPSSPTNSLSSSPTNYFSNISWLNNDEIQEIVVKSSIPINISNNNISNNNNDYVILNTNNVLSFITNSLVNEENNDDIICILDNSGSMDDDEKLDKSIEGIISIINSLKTFQRITVLTFSVKAKQIFPLQQITPLNKDSIVSIVKNIVTEGNTIYNNALNSIKRIIDESNGQILENEQKRKNIVLFFSDGEHNDTPKVSILDELFTTYPELLFYTISIGNDIDSCQNLIPLHRNRPVELGQYFDCPNMEKFTEIIGNIIGNSKPLFAKNICFTFDENIKLFTTYENILNDDQTISIKIPIVNTGDAFNIAFKNNNSELNVKINYTFTRVSDDVEINGISVFDENNILPKEITVYYPDSKYILYEHDLIINSNTLTKEDKKNMLIEIRNNINIENNGIYCEMLLNTINSSIELQNNLYIPLESVNRNISIRQSSNTQTSPVCVSRCVSNTIFSNSQLSDDENI
jgi:uncharacterized protein YegL